MDKGSKRPLPWTAITSHKLHASEYCHLLEIFKLQSANRTIVFGFGKDNGLHSHIYIEDKKCKTIPVVRYYIVYGSYMQ